MRILRIRDVDQETGEESNERDVPLLDFLSDNADGLDPEDAAAIATLEPGYRHWIGGGAAPLVYVTRIV